MQIAVLLLSIAEAWAHSAEVQADGGISGARLSLNEQAHLASVRAHGASEEEAFKDATAANGYIECASEGGNCSCADGVVLYGRPTLGEWRELRVDGSTLCTATLFDTTPAPEGETNVCRCYSLNWCNRNNVDAMVFDPSHRRRNALGTPGKNLHQRRRWCGWGPRDCAWSSWSKWTDCQGGHECADSGTSERTRQMELEAANGGICKQETSIEKTKCSWVGCKDEKAEKVDKAAKDEKVEKDETSSEIPVEVEEKVSEATLSSEELAAARQQKAAKLSAAATAMNQTLALPQAEKVVPDVGASLVQAALAGGASENAAAAASAKLQANAMVKAELGQLTALTLAQMGANLLVESRAQVPRGATLKVLRELVVAVAGHAIVEAIGDDSLAGSQVAGVQAGKIADALGLALKDVRNSDQLFGNHTDDTINIFSVQHP